MEAAGLAVGIIGLAGLFNCCSGAFHLVQKGRSFGKDYKILETKFKNQELRLRAWGRACGLVDGTEYDIRLDEQELCQQLQATLECIKLLLEDAKELKDRYGLRPFEGSVDDEESESLAISASSSAGGSSNGSLERRRSINRLFLRRPKTPRNRPNSSLATATWVIEDREKFSELVRHLKDLIDDLEDLTRATEIPRRQLIFIDYEIESISDMETLEEIEMARQGDEDAVSDAASLRLEQISQGTTSIRASMESGRDGSFITLESYFTARTHFSRTSGIDEVGNILPPPAAQPIRDREASDANMPPRAAAPFARALPPARSQSVKSPGFQIDRAKISAPVALVSTTNVLVYNAPDLPTSASHQHTSIMAKDEANGKDAAPGSANKAVIPCYKCVVVGEPSSRKTELLSVFTLGYHPAEYRPLVFKEYVTNRVDGRRVDLALWDTSGQEDYDRIRINTYSRANVFIICFLIGSSPNLEQVRDKWAYELQERCPGVQYVLVGMEPDASHKATTTELAQGNSLSREIGARKYIQCNVETGAGIDDAFEATTRVAMLNNPPPPLPRQPKGWKLPWRTEKSNLQAIKE